MGVINFSWTDENGLSDKVARWESLKQVFPDIERRELTEMYNRGKSDGGTPVRTGELMASLTLAGNELTYVKDYASHVEYGHRTRGGGYVEGQRYLEANVNAQEPIFREHLIQILGE